MEFRIQYEIDVALKKNVVLDGRYISPFAGQTTPKSKNIYPFFILPSTSKKILFILIFKSLGITIN